MTVAEHKKYLEQMDEYIKKIKEESRDEALDFLTKAGIVDKDGKLMPQYQER
jgi:hypothetical protein